MYVLVMNRLIELRMNDYLILIEEAEFIKKNKSMMKRT
jgi:hypothetical protein